jgi:flagellar assembly protein FliH
LHKIIKAECLGPGALLEPHCFPEFIGDLSTFRCTEAEDHNLFRRVDLGDSASGALGSAATGEGQSSRDPHQDCEDDGDLLTKEMQEQILLQGIAQGEARGRESERKKIEPLRSNWVQSLDDLERLRHRLCLQMEAETVRLAVAIARKIVAVEAAVNPEMVLRVVRSALAEVLDREKITIRLHPQDCSMIEEHREGLVADNDTSGDTRIQSDETVDRGGCIIVTPQGEIDARIDKQMQSVEKALNKELQYSLTQG